MLTLPILPVKAEGAVSREADETDDPGNMLISSVPASATAPLLHTAATAMAAAPDESLELLFEHRFDGGADVRPKPIRERIEPCPVRRWRAGCCNATT